MGQASAHPIAYYTHASIPDRIILERVAHANRMRAEELPDDPPVIAEDAVRRMRSLPSCQRFHAWVMHDGFRIVAEASLFWAELASNRKAAMVHVSVERRWRRRGVGTQLLALAVARARRALRPLLLACSSGRVPAGATFLNRLGFKPALSNHFHQLSIEQLDRALLARWQAPTSKSPSDYVVEVWDGPVPEPWLVRFADFYGVMNAIPRGDLKVEDTMVTPRMIREGEAYLFADGNRRLIAAARHVASGALVGFTELTWNPRQASLVWQLNTGVIAEHRNNGLGRWLKAANMEAMLGANPEARFVRTSNADSNAPMLAINRQMGFAPFSAQTVWQGAAPVVAQRLLRCARLTPPLRSRFCVPGR